MASVYRKNRKWYIHIRDASGRWKDTPTKVDTKTKAKQLAHALELKYERQRLGLEPLPTDCAWTIAELLKWCLETHWEKKSQHAKPLASYLRVNIIEAPMGAVPIAQATRERIEAFLESKSVALSPRSVNHLRGYLHAAFNRAIRLGKFAGRNPVAEVQRQKVPKRIPDYLRAHEVPLVLDALPPQWRSLFACALWTGLRKGELLALRKCDIDLAARELTVRRSWKLDLTKGGHERVLPVVGELVPFLESAIEQSPSELVFPGSDGEMMSRNVHLVAVFRHALARAGIVTGYEHVCRRKGCGHAEKASDAALRLCLKCNMKLWPKAKVRPIRFHDTRHTTATLLLKAGVPLATVQRILRHSDPRITSETYGHLDIDDMREGLEHLSATLGGPRKDDEAHAIRLPLAANLLTTPEIAEDGARAPAKISRENAGVRWSGRQDLNLRPLGPEPSALPG